ncbi:periplasmic trehalase [Halalkalicoccus paucihalophilus]|uniref:Periplasmic trehalase n=1 Tax=Halalkalicoccus paucihalophilus TaxID=1008153 RepID=A0A151A8U5_9EURY|nr:alpha,alpha-trehalase TreF [Halalkalicoccus paucihalophilus]KYH23922.1 periplasmic trehalase [Halalkalicoccus paucihalophilus]
MRSLSSYPQLAGDLFKTVQQSGTFSDSKTFVDAVPDRELAEIRERFEREHTEPDFDMREFVAESFTLPEDPVAAADPSTVSMEWYIDELWTHLIRDPSEEQEWSTRLSVPRRYVIAGGRFRESYYWDTYFAAIGLAVTGRINLIADLAENCAALIDQYGCVPNGNRLYYASRSHPPMFCHLLDILESERGIEAVRSYLPELRREYEFWMDGSEEVTDTEPAFRRVVHTEQAVLNRYWDDRAAPREESYREDVTLAETSERENRQLYRDVRAACESGWDFSSRWLTDQDDLATIRTTKLLPVDLNALCYAMENKLSRWERTFGNQEHAEKYARTAERRRQAVDELCWDDEAGFYFDYSWSKKCRTETWSLAAVVPLFCRMATEEQAAKVAAHLKERFLHSGGLVTTLTESGEQWDAPNGWAPLHWMASVGLHQYGHERLAEMVAGRWLDLNREVFDRNGLMLEKYDVTDGSGRGSGGEYPLQYGFGWTNGVALALPALFY